MRYVGLLARMEDRKGAYKFMGDRKGTFKFMVGKLEGKRPHGRQRRIWEDNIKIIFGKWDREAWIG